MVHAGVSQAAKIGLTLRAPVRLWLEMQFSLGSDFDSDPQLAWASASLIDAAQYSLGCAEALYAASGRHFDAVAGPDNQYLVDALMRAIELPYSAITSPMDAEGFIALLTVLTASIAVSCASRREAMSSTPNSNAFIAEEQAKEVAVQDARRAYRDLSPYRIEATLKEGKWHIDFHLKDPRPQGGGPTYIIDATTGKILSKKYYQ
jgi:hypothetical protein